MFKSRSQDIRLSLLYLGSILGYPLRLVVLTQMNPLTAGKPAAKVCLIITCTLSMITCRELHQKILMKDESFASSSPPFTVIVCVRGQLWEKNNLYRSGCHVKRSACQDMAKTSFRFAANCIFSGLRGQRRILVWKVQERNHAKFAKISA